MEVITIGKDIVDIVNKKMERNAKFGKVTKGKQVTYLEAFEWQKTHKLVGMNAKYKTPYYIGKLVEVEAKEYTLEHSRWNSKTLQMEPEVKVFGRYFECEEKNEYGWSEVRGGEKAKFWIATELNGKPL